VIVHTFDYQRDYHLSAAEVTRIEGIRTAGLAAHV
jgi:cytochrome o ubiquinol oxidase subunit 1